ncbi:MAG: N-acetylmuramoyl-L-alanine amidase [Lachnospiraceae bacterium]|nr:N-acetylmuramoyl-L-alanine amidase [Lachnospiraceae bacterium]
MEKKKFEKLHIQHILWMLTTIFILSLVFSSGTAFAAADTVVPADTAGEIQFTKSTTTIKAGKTYTFKASATGTDEPVTFESSNEKVAKIDNHGKMTAIKAGTTSITARAGRLAVSVKVTVKSKKIVALDPGHTGVVAGGTEPIGPGSKTMKAKDASGTRGVVTKIPEYELTLSLAKKMKKLLEARGYKVVMTRTNSKKPLSCVSRAKIANKAKADIYVRIHADGIDNRSVSGASALYPTKSNPYVGKLSKKSKKLSRCILNAMCKRAKANNRGLSPRDDLSGSNWAKMPVTLIEVGFMTNPAEDRKMATDKYRNKLARGMVEGIDNYFGY